MANLSAKSPLGHPHTPYLHVTASQEIPEATRNCVLAIGNFDGVHRGHQAVLQMLLDHAEAANVPAFALTFEPHPRTLFKPDSPIFRLTGETEKARLFGAVGLAGDIVRGFTREFASQSADAFVEDVLLAEIAPRHVVIGYDFHFGRNRQGSPDFLVERSRRDGFGVTVVEAYGDEAGDAVSSSQIRSHLENGEVAEAAGLLGYRWFATGPVIHGEKRGRNLGYPTANMQLAPDCGLAHGVYAVRMEVDGARYDGVGSYGRRPMFDNGAPLFETHLFDFSGDLYGKHVTVAVFGRLREEMAFDSVDGLIAQMDRDSAEARALLSGVAPLSPIDSTVNFA
ncbi:MAG: bifunctional riboflavin kinase/FAD synthetase [Pseudomonadota bacterium]